jgi:hypothetical protein
MVGNGAGWSRAERENFRLGASRRLPLTTVDSVG